MKRTVMAILAALLTAVGFANPEILKDAWLKGTTDKTPIFYNPGETMVFTIEPQDTCPKYSRKSLLFLLSAQRQY